MINLRNWFLSKKIIALTCDTCCFDKLEISQSKGLIIQLCQLEKEGKIKIYHDFLTKIETDKLKGDYRDKTIDWIKENSNLPKIDCSVNINATEKEKKREHEAKRGYTFQESDNLNKRINLILFKYINEKNKTNLNDYIDSRLLALHILYRRDIFVTKNKSDFISKGKWNIKEELEKEFPGLCIRELNQSFLQEINNFSFLKLVYNRIRRKIFQL